MIETNVSNFGVACVHPIYDIVASNDVSGFDSANFGIGSSCSIGCSSSFKRGSSKVVNPNIDNSPSVDDIEAQFVDIENFDDFKEKFLFCWKWISLGYILLDKRFALHLEFFFFY